MRISAIIFLLLLTVSRAFSADPQYDSGLPIDVTADRLEADNASRQINFQGSVVAKQADVVIYAGELTLFLAPETQDVLRIEGKGDVRIVQGDRVATGEKAVFYREEGRIVLTGSPQVHRGQDAVSGEEIIVLLNEERSIVKGGESSRVKATFTPRENDE